MGRKTKRVLYLSFGWIMFSLGFIGAFLPVLPTTPFMLLALWGFSKGSKTLHNWLYNHPRYGETLRDWDQDRIIPLKAKITALTMMILSASYLIFFSGIDDLLIASALGLMLIGAIFILTKPSQKAGLIEKSDDKSNDQSSSNTIK